MSEVLRYLIQKTPIGTMMKPNPEGNWIAAKDFDRVTAERDAALAELRRYQSLFNQAQKAIDRLNELHRKRMAEIGRRLTAADERVDVLEAALRTIMGSHRFNMSGMKVEETHAICFDALTGKAALKPAEGGGEIESIGGKCWSCKEPVTLIEWVESDGNCPHCNVEIDEAEGIRP